MLRSKSLSSFSIITLFIIYFGLYLFFFQSFLASLILSNFGKEGLTISLAISNVILLILFFLICWKFYSWNFEKFFCNLKGNTKAVLKGTICLFVSELLISNLIVMINPNIVSDNQLNNETLLQLSPACFIFMSVIVGPIVEETIFRGCIFKTIRDHHSFLLAAIISGSIFGLLHITASLITANWGNCLYFFIYAITGFILCIPYEETESIATSMFVHMLINFISVVLLWMM